MFLLDLDPNVVKPGWTPLIITILLASALVFLYTSMRRQFRRINVNPAGNGEATAEDEAVVGEESAGPSEDDEQQVRVDDAAVPQAERDESISSDAPPPRTN